MTDDRQKELALPPAPTSSAPATAPERDFLSLRSEGGGWLICLWQGAFVVLTLRARSVRRAREIAKSATLQWRPTTGRRITVGRPPVLIDGANTHPSPDTEYSAERGAWDLTCPKD